MANVLLLTHRIPYPPNKGDKVRSYHLLKHLASKHRVFLGTFVDDSADEQYVGRIREVCSDACFLRIHPRLRRIRSLSGLFLKSALGLHYYRHSAMQRWVSEVARENHLDAVVIFSSVMAQYAMALDEKNVLVDFVDVDSAKWVEYASNHFWPLSWLYRREGRKLLDYERDISFRTTRSFFVTEKEATLFMRLAPECGPRVSVVNNGVDAEYFSPELLHTSPFPSASIAPVVFTGAMDYWPNIDAVKWFVAEILPRVRKRYSSATFYVVGRNPPESVRILASDSVIVTGTVPDVRPYLQHAGVVVAPLRLARGIQNKILEAMAMGRPVVGSATCVESLGKLELGTLMSASTAVEFADCVTKLFDSPAMAATMGAMGRQHVVAHSSWHAHMAQIDAFISALDANGLHAR